MKRATLLVLLVLAGSVAPVRAEDVPFGTPLDPAISSVGRAGADGFPDGLSAGSIPARGANGGVLGDIAPPYRSGLTGPIYTAQATWCAPTPNHCQSWGEPAHLAAVYGFTFGDAPYWVRVSRGAAHTDALVVSHCACHGRHDRIDLSPASFRELAALRLGRVAVSVEVLAWPYEPGGDPPSHPADDRMRAEDSPRVTAPPTDTAP